MKVGTLPAQGFTLLETVVSLGVFGLCLALALPFLGVQKAIWEDQQAFREEYSALCAALAWITRDLQEAGYRCPGPAVTELREQRMTYALSRDEDEPAHFSSRNRRLITVSLKGQSLMYRIQAWDPEASSWGRGSSHTIARGVRKVRFSGLDAAGREASDPSAVVSVAMTLTGKRTGPVRTLATLRNRDL